MERVKKAGGDLINGYWGENIIGGDEQEPVLEDETKVKLTNDEVTATISLDDLREHDKYESPWFVLHGEVYDGTAYLKDHPGGAQSIISVAATDATDEFMAIRKSNCIVDCTYYLTRSRQRYSQGNDERLPHRHTRLRRKGKSRKWRRNIRGRL